MASRRAALRRVGHPLAEGAIARLLALSFPSLYSRDTLSFTLGFFDQLVQAVPCNELWFTPDERMTALVRDS